MASMFVMIMRFGNRVWDRAAFCDLPMQFCKGFARFGGIK